MLPIIPPSLLLSAYRQGLFPMAETRGDDDIFWVEPRERAIIPIGGFRCSRSLARTIRQDRFEVRCDTDFGAVIEACAAPRGNGEDSWISARIAATYQRLHEVGHAHAIECWQDGQLVGGVYGVAFDRVFCGESMFSRERDASKVALGWMLALLERAGCLVFDCQFMTDHLASLGAVAITQEEYVARLGAARGLQRRSLPQEHAELLAQAQNQDVSPGKLIAHSLSHTS